MSEEQPTKDTRPRRVVAIAIQVEVFENPRQSSLEDDPKTWADNMLLFHQRDAARVMEHWIREARTDIILTEEMSDTIPAQLHELAEVIRRQLTVRYTEEQS